MPKTGAIRYRYVWKFGLVCIWLLSTQSPITIHHSLFTDHHFEIEKRPFLEKKVYEIGVLLVSETQAGGIPALIL